jgi:hypothetical protein
MSKKKKMKKSSSHDEPSAAAKIKSRKEKKLQKPTDGLDETNKAMVEMAAKLGNFVASPQLSGKCSDLRTWSHTICGIKDTSSAFRNVVITVILVVCTSPGILMTSSLSGVRVNPRWRSTVVSCEILTWWIGRASSRRLIAHIIHICSTERLSCRYWLDTLRFAMCSSEL